MRTSVIVAGMSTPVHGKFAPIANLTRIYTGTGDGGVCRASTTTCCGCPAEHEPEPSGPLGGSHAFRVR
jgi:hypothetical protein